MKFNIINVSNVGSTNSYAQELNENGTLCEGDVILTHKQEKGRGQGDNFWESEPGANLTFSLILEPEFIAPANQFVLTQALSLAISDLLKSYLMANNIDQEVKIKWPNDIYIENKKICGILFQNFIKGDKIDFSIVGIGVNINQRIFYSDAKNPVSLIQYFEQDVSIDEILENLLSCINTRYKSLKIAIDNSLLKDEYLNNLYRYFEWADYADDRGEFTGKIVDVDGYGRLSIEKKNGELKQYLHKEIEFLV
ncbi:MAG: biotin--[acetyl-CoA-carboxylase] ligase [Bacteroidetes bacterium]|nr:biotin--[acetyl-CoA-carboxylase] ligase [Bacteroidota bacterium]